MLDFHVLYKSAAYVSYIFFLYLTDKLYLFFLRYAKYRMSYNYVCFHYYLSRLSRFNFLKISVNFAGPFIMLFSVPVYFSLPIGFLRALPNVTAKT